MKARLFCTTGFFAGSNFEFTKEATIGKSRANSIVLAPPIVSSRHARIYFDEKSQSYILEDLGSRNGTQVDGVRVKKKEKLEALSIITFAQKFDFIFQVIDHYEGEPAKKKMAQSETTAAMSPGRPEKKTGVTPLLTKDETAETFPANGKANGKTMLEAAPMPFRAASKEKTSLRRNGKTLREVFAENNNRSTPQPVFLLEMRSQGRRLKTIRLKNGENFLGRSPQCEIAIDDPSISRRHAVLTINANKVFVKDLGSRNHTFVGMQTAMAEIEIQPGTPLRFGNVEARLIQTFEFEKRKASSIGHLV
ncbi:MAG: FHA domain-containing protein [candidate division KSB1 bacterium]|nr:FHA domain-containing protein [candidate division KSB1 bacterium]MDZ7365201.1 FHA domain-containing protein [candidate division KSB1 bacterium]MDZ7406957.1 FHA domain-containing protein [candidate division KSB1 bacterium]